MAVVIDRWRRDRATGKLVATARDGKGLRYLSHFRDASGCEVTKAFALKRDAQRWLDEQTAQLIHGTYVHPTAAMTTVAQWCETWLSGYASRRPRTVRQARVHLAQITTTFGTVPWPRCARRMWSPGRPGSRLTALLTATSTRSTTGCRS